MHTSTFPPACPVIWGRRNGLRWFLAIDFCHPPSFFPVPPFHVSVHSIPPPCPRSSSFPVGFMSIIWLQFKWSSFCHAQTTSFDFLSLLDIFATVAAPHMCSYVHTTFLYLMMSTSNNCTHGQGTYYIHAYTSVVSDDFNIKYQEQCR